MLAKTLPFRTAWHDTASALWLKAIYFDSGVVPTPAQALLKAYDSLSGVERPDFLPG